MRFWRSDHHTHRCCRCKRGSRGHTEACEHQPVRLCRRCIRELVAAPERSEAI